MTVICEICGQEHKTTVELEEEAGLRPKMEVGNDAVSLPAEPLPSSSKRKRKIDTEKQEETT